MRKPGFPPVRRSVGPTCIKSGPAACIDGRPGIAAAPGRASVVFADAAPARAARGAGAGPVR